MTKAPSSDQVRGSRFFADLTDHELQSVVSLGRSKFYNSGDQIFQEDEPSGFIVVLCDGKLEVKQGQTILATVEKTGVVGEMGVFTQTPRTATVVAADHCSVLEIPATDLRALFESNKEIGYKLYKNVTYILSQYLKENNLLLAFNEMLVKTS